MLDNLSIYQAQTTSTASAASAAVDTKNGTPFQGYRLRFNFSAAANASGANTATFGVDHSDDGATWSRLANVGAGPLALSTSAQGGEAIAHFHTKKRYVRAALDIAGAGTSPTVTWSAAQIP